MLVRLSDGTCVNKPVFYGKDWYIRIDEMGPYIMIKVRTRTVPLGINVRIARVLNAVGIKWRGLSNGAYMTTSAFPPRWQGLHNCASVRLRVKGPIPVDVSRVAGGMVREEIAEGKIVIGD